MTRRSIGKTIAAAIVFTIVCWLGWCIYKATKLEQYRRNLAARGFPLDYVARLSKLQFDYPNWIFIPLPVADISWDEIVEKEFTPSWNLVISADWAPDQWNALKKKNYTPYYAPDAKAYDSGSWYQASREAIAYFMDPRNFLSERDIFQFEALNYDAASQTPTAVEKMLSKTFMANRGIDGGRTTFSAFVTGVGKKLGVSPVFLAGRLASEQGSGSPQAFGTIGDALFAYAINATGRVGEAQIWGKRFVAGGAATKRVLAKGKATYNGHYNFFNFRAYGLGVFEIRYNAWIEAASDETRQKYCGPWKTQARAIEGGAMKIKERYIDTHRHTRYLQKFSVLPAAREFRWKQYMQNIAAPLVESRNTANAYEAAGTLDAPYRFLIPVYRKMPAHPSPDPAKGRSVYSVSR